MNESEAIVTADSTAAQKRVAQFVLRAGLFWNNHPLPITNWIGEDGIFYHHGSTSAPEHFFSFLCSIGVLLQETRAHRLAIRPDAVAGYAVYLIDKGEPIEGFIDALVCLGGESWLEISRQPFTPTFYEKSDGAASFDCRPLMLDLVFLGYAEKRDDLFQWTAKMEPILQAHFY